MYECPTLFGLCLLCFQEMGFSAVHFKDHETHFKGIFLGVLLGEIRELLVSLSSAQSEGEQHDS